jgi:hypothetical protein
LQARGVYLGRGGVFNIAETSLILIKRRYPYRSSTAAISRRPHQNSSMPEEIDDHAEAADTPDARFETAGTENY